MTTHFETDTSQASWHRHGPASAATHTRYKVLAMAMALGAITYLDRVAISVTRPDIARDLQLTPIQMGYVFSAFYLAYALFEIPTGWWGDRVGTRSVLTRIVCWWSTFTVLTGLAFNHSSLVCIRFLFGSGEAGAWPNVARTFSRWFPRQERGTAQGVFFMSAHLAGGLTPMLVTLLLGWMNWRSLFAVVRNNLARSVLCVTRPPATDIRGAVHPKSASPRCGVRRGGDVPTAAAGRTTVAVLASRAPSWHGDARDDNARPIR